MSKIPRKAIVAIAACTLWALPALSLCTPGDVKCCREHPEDPGCPPTPNPPTLPSCQQPGSGEVTLFEHSNFEGRCTVFRSGDYPKLSKNDRFPNDAASSVLFGPGAAVQLCQHEFLEGICEVLSRNDANLGDNRIRHDQASSAVVIGEGHFPYNCRLQAQTPRFEPRSPAGGVITASGSRGPRCYRSAVVEALLRQDRPLWDRTLDSERGGGTDVTLSVRYDCAGNRAMNVYLELRAGSQKDQSRRVGVQSCVGGGDPDPITIPLTLERQIVPSGPIPYRGEISARPGRLLQIRVPQAGPADVAVKFVKPGRRTDECDSPSAVVEVPEGQTTTPAQMNEIFGVAEPRFSQANPLIVIACMGGGGPVLNFVQLQATVRFDGHVLPEPEEKVPPIFEEAKSLPVSRSRISSQLSDSAED